MKLLINQTTPKSNKLTTWGKGIFATTNNYKEPYPLESHKNINTNIEISNMRDQSISDIINFLIKTSEFNFPQIFGMYICND